MNDVKKIWWQLVFRNNYDNRREYQSSRQRSESFVRAYTFYSRANISYNNQQTSYFNAQYQSYNMKQSYYFNRQQFYQSKKKTQSQLSSSKQSLVIINTTSASQSIYSIKYNQSSNRYENKQNKQKTYQTTVEDEKNDQSMKHENTVFINFAEYDKDDNKLYYEKQTVAKNDSDEVFIDFVDLETRYKHCRKIFSFNNKLHFHLRHEQCIKKVDKVERIAFTKTSFSDSSTFAQTIDITMYSAEMITDNKINFALIEIIESKTSIEKLSFDIEFRNWNFLKALVKFFVADSRIHVCVDTECEATLKNKQFVKDKCSDVDIHTMTIFFRIRDIEAITHEISEYVRISILFSKTTKSEKRVLTQITREIHLIDEFKANLLIENDFLDFKDFTIDISNKKTSITSCDVDIDLSIKQREFYVRRNIHAIQTILISSKEEISISAKFSVFDDRDFLFESTKKVNFTLFHHIVDSYTNEIMIRNDSFNAVKISKNFCLKFVIELTYDDCFQIEFSEIYRIMTVSKRNWIKQSKTVATNFILLLSSKTISHQFEVQAIFQFENFKKCKLSNEIMIYEDQNSIHVYIKLMNEFLVLWHDEDFINISKKQWMKFFLRQDWQSYVNEKFRVYFLNIENRKMINKTFDELQRQKRFQWTTFSTSFSYFVFVTWRTINEVRKNRVVVNIRDLNKLLVFDAYSLSLQSDIIANIQECTHISILDAVFFFYQWKTHSNDAYKQTIVTFRDQEIFLVSIMSNRNSVLYVQRQMNQILRHVRHFAKTFINDIVIKSRSFSDHIIHFRSIFKIFSRLNISIKLIKVFLSYSNVVLLKQRVDELKLSTTKKKLKVIVSLKFSNILKNLKHYLKLTKYIRNHIYYYFAIVKSLQNLKTILLKTTSVDSKRRQFINKVKISSTQKELLFFEILQNVLSKSTMLFHFVASNTL